jgi:hypothetical protein
VELLHGGLNEGKENKAAGALLNLAGEAANRVVIITAGGILPLMELLRYGDSAEERRSVAGALYQLTLNDAAKRQVVGLGYTRDQLKVLLD